MSQECAQIHSLLNRLRRHTFPFDKHTIPLNGIYVLFQKDETGHGQERIVRIGTHTGNNQLRSRLKQHFIDENKDRSIFRKNIGRALMKKGNDSFLSSWEHDLTTGKARKKYLPLIDLEYQRHIEEKVSQFMKEDFSFVVFAVESKEARLEIESKLISTVSWCDECGPSDAWLGSHSTKPRIVQSGLWQVNELYKTPFDMEGLKWFSDLIQN